MTVLFMLQAVLGVLLASVLLRAQWRRRDNRLLALICLIDAAQAVTTGLLVESGLPLTGDLPMRASLISRILVVHPLLEFSYAFPSGKQPPRWVRWAGVTATALATLAALLPATAGWVDNGFGRLLFFLPFFVGTARAVRHNLQQTARTNAAHGVRPLLVGMVFLSAEALLVYVGIRELLPQLFPLARALDIVICVSSYSVLAYAVLAHQAFRVRGVVAEALLYGALATSCLVLTVTAVEMAAEHVPHPALRTVAFGLLMLVPVVSWILVERHALRFEHAVLSPFDPRRRLLRSVLQRVLQDSVNMVEPVALCELTRAAMAELSGSEALLWSVERESDGGRRPNVAERVLPSPLAERFRHSSMAAIHKEERSLLDAAQTQALEALAVDALIPVRVQGKLWCVFSVRGAIHQDTLDTFEALAANLGNKLTHHAMYERAFELQAQLDTSNRLATLGSFAAAVAHDIRTPLTSVKMNLEIIRAQSELSPDMTECADMALEELKRMNDYVSGMLDYLKPVQLRAVDFDVRTLIEETARTMQPLLESRKVGLLCEAADGAPLPAMRADVSRLKQVLLNLVENAADASEPGHTIRLSVTGYGPGQLAISVRDQGHGISASNLEKVFDPFFTTRESGTGLGLAIVRKLVRAHGGEVQVASSLGGGSTFTVVLPACSASATVHSYA